jgi:hypothetical protein
VNPEEDPDGPPGTARVRTRLSWRRTALSATGVMLLTLRAALRLDGTLPRALIIGLGVLGWRGLLALGQSRMVAMSANPPGPAGRTPAAMALGIAGFAVLGVATAVLL